MRSVENISRDLSYSAKELIECFKQQHQLYKFKNHRAQTSGWREPFTEEELIKLYSCVPQLYERAKNYYSKHPAVSLLLRVKDLPALFDSMNGLAKVMGDLLERYESKGGWAWIPEIELSSSLSVPLLKFYEQAIIKGNLKFLEALIKADSYLSEFFRLSFIIHLKGIVEGHCASGFASTFSRLHIVALGMKVFLSIEPPALEQGEHALPKLSLFAGRYQDFPSSKPEENFEKNIGILLNNYSHYLEDEDLSQAFPFLVGLDSTKIMSMQLGKKVEGSYEALIRLRDGTLINIPLLPDKVVEMDTCYLECSRPFSLGHN